MTIKFSSDFKASNVSFSKLLKGFIDNGLLLPDVLIRELKTDSRQVQVGDLFMAYPGFHTDGRLYIKEALNRGAAAVLYDDTSNYKLSINSSVPLISIVGLRSRIGEIAARFYGYPAKYLKIIGITGTNGKTSCAHFIAQLLQFQNVSCAVLSTLGYGSINSLKKINCTTPDPLKLQKILAHFHKSKIKVVIIEVSSHALDQWRVSGIRFSIAVFTQLSRDHLDYHKSMKNYARAKELLFQQTNLSFGVINYDDVFGKYLITKYYKKLTIIGYSIKKDAKDDRISLVIATTVKMLTQGNFSVTVQTPWGSGILTTSLYGRFNIINFLAVIGVLGLFNIPLKKVLVGLSKLKNISGRMQIVRRTGSPRIVIDYAHTPHALKNILVSLRECCNGQLICVFGCGGNRDRGKRSQMGAIAERYADQIIITNDNPRNELPLTIIQDIQLGFKNPQSIMIETDRTLAIRSAVQKATVNDIVLIAGKGHETTQIIDKKVFPFNDLQKVKEALVYETFTSRSKT
ncbi:UDP-N-acetylmuramoyl-L-alanyl-D-glutamate--2,6-diaminopimelate ligase [Coxiella endosymbiont of Amblyomma americanum]|uniref:UDP-N-acetylmuramoyl-L-alanyl-D-glutamate--2, 6-diaminopimelate ligase n=1 Tax=Coxiella endosymbiont of Amblyomma americanum TaxID=325775 RepID=UPI000581FE41|nr:UDP-N-acetylmuramoyl-L-alanyl-D-glutamate--2,6-diaminopimelate ligase [Coxiella endosymbiont of Amblyomma americanum]AJC50389.1 UDP-N-acetylmuramoylalanyl-D-glutamate--2,6-diaminopimelate ligase [Coxiella endosymbiont of Amblyomma americanum]AUJ58730.1 UDP-N-acetylmuramoyl-L-alanyl-D-glutamate--2,6-diaminopimelate ligase [Coxiella-like endosymbiont of Amblyomma americanum]